MKIYFNEKMRKGPWGGGIYFLSSLVNHLRKNGHKVVFNLKKNIDLIFILSNSPYDYERKFSGLFRFKEKYPKIKVLHRINVSDISKNTNMTDSLVFKTNSIADRTVFISNWLADYYKSQGFEKDYKVIYNGCNSDYYYPSNEEKKMDTVKLVTHHWSDNWMKGFDIYGELDEILAGRDDIMFTYVGRFPQNFKFNNTSYISPLYGKSLGNELRKHDIYLTAARWEGCGMHHIEGACCGLPVLYHKDGGGINESCQNYGIEYHDLPSLLKAIEEMRKNYQEYQNKIPYEFLDSERVNDEYYNIILDMFT